MNEKREITNIQTCGKREIARYTNREKCESDLRKRAKKRETNIDFSS